MWWRCPLPEGQNGDSYRILAAYSNTTVSVTGTIITNVDESSGPPWTVKSVYETLTTGLTNGVPFDIIVDGAGVVSSHQADSSGPVWEWMVFR